MNAAEQNIVVYLVKMLERSNVELLILCITFLKKLSIYQENKEKMAECNMIASLVKFVPVPHDVLLMAVLRLLHNLSFDTDMREDMAKSGIIPKVVQQILSICQDCEHACINNLYKQSEINRLNAFCPEQVVNLIQDPRFQPIVLGLLYHLSIEEGHKSLFAFTDAIPIIFNMLMSVTDFRQTPELIALAVNITQNQRNAEVDSHKQLEFCGIVPTCGS